MVVQRENLHSYQRVSYSRFFFESPIVRINPNELHVNDPDFYDVCSLGAGRRTEKPKAYVQSLGSTQMGFATTPHEHHKLRRNAITPFFSKRCINTYAPLIQNVIDKFCRRLEDAKRKGEVINVKCAYAALTTDIINEYSFSRTHDVVLEPDFNVEYYDPTMALSQFCHVVSKSSIGQAF